MKTTRNGAKGLSIRSKLFLLLLSLPLAVLAFYLLITTRLFMDDKTAYVFDSSAAVTRSLASQISSELRLIQMAMRPVIEGYSAARNDFDPVARKTLDAEERILGVFLVNSPGGAGASSAAELANSRRVSREEWSQARTRALEASKFVTADLITVYPVVNPIRSASSRHLSLVATAYQLPGRTGKFAVLILVQMDRLMELFGEANTYRKFLVNEAGQVLYGPSSPKAAQLSEFPKLLSKHRLEGSESITLEDSGNSAGSGGESSFLAAYSKVGTSDLYVISTIENSVAFRSVEILLAKSVLFFFLMIGCTVILSLLASRRLTSALGRLHQAAHAVARGDFNARVVVSSRDEVGDLGVSFNHMAGRISELLKENIQKVRMEKELETAKLVQETLLPDSHLKFGALEVASLYQPASECGGDWWHCFELKGKVYLWMGDVTGHGVPAALMTAAARATSEAIHTLGASLTDALTPAQILSFMNRTFLGTSKGQLLMSCFVACFDVKTRRLAYSNASHCPPYWSRSPEAGAAGFLTFLDEANGPILGMKLDARYQEAVISVRPGDALVLYTDGLIDAVNAEGKRFGRKNLEESIAQATAQNGKASGILQSLQDSVTRFRQEAALEDDLTMSVYKLEDPASLYNG